MNRLGRALLLGFAALIALFLVLSRWGSSPAPEPAAKRPEPPPRVAEDADGLVIPIAGVTADRLYDSFAEPRGDGSRTHGATDIMAPRGTPVLAAAAGRVEKLFDSAAGGRTVYIRSMDDGTVYYYAHLDAYAAGLAEGQVVKRGQIIATVGATGDADPGTPHLHFEIKRMKPGEKWYQGTAVNPYPILRGSR